MAVIGHKRTFMTQAFLILSRRYGGDVRDPTDGDLQSALREVFVEDHPDLSDADYEEHPSAFLRVGMEDGTMYVLYASRGGELTLEQWADSDFEAESAAPTYLHRATSETALGLWRAAKAGDLAAIRVHEWLEA